jgi:hypothetical protein
MSHLCFLADGHQRALEGLKRNLQAALLKIQKELETEFAPKLAASGFVMRLLLKIKMKLELKRRFAEVIAEFDAKVPPDALYFKPDTRSKKKQLSD